MVRNLAYADVQGLILLRQLANGNSQLLTTLRDVAIERIAWFPDNTRMVVSGRSRLTAKYRIWTLSREERTPSVFREDGKDAVPSPGGTTVAFTSGDGMKVRLAGSSDSSTRTVASTAKPFSFPPWCGPRTEAGSVINDCGSGCLSKASCAAPTSSSM